MIDVAKLIRIRASLDAALATAKTAADAPGLSKAYLAHRREVASMLDGELLAEFDRLYPEAHYQGSPVVPIDLQLRWAEVVPLLSGMSGWLNGLIQADQISREIAANAEAYAREKVRAERGIGFKDPK